MLKQASALILQNRMTTAIGKAVWLPAIPTSGAAAPPKINGSSPRSADALPADFPWLCMAKDPLVVVTIPMQETTTNSGIKIRISGALKKTETNKTTLAVKDSSKPLRKRDALPNRPASLPVI